MDHTFPVLTLRDCPIEIREKHRTFKNSNFCSPSMEQNWVYFSACDILIFQYICVSFARSLSAPCLLTHACVNRQLVTRRFPAYLSVEILKLSFKKFSFREKNPPHPDPENNVAHSWGRPRLFFFSVQAPIGSLQKEKSSWNPPSRQSMMFICNNEVVYCMFGPCISAHVLKLEIVSCYLSQNSVYAIWHVPLKLLYTATPA